MHTNQQMQIWIDQCQNCSTVCLQTVAHCLKKGGIYTGGQLVGLLLDCAEICRANANIMARGSTFHGLTSAVCAEICRACAQECAVLHEDPELKNCAQVCLQCEQSCREMAGMASE